MLNKEEIIKIGAFACTNYIIQYLNEKQIDVTNLKLQKLLYFAYGIHLAHFNKRLFESEIQAWPFGPVIPDVYFEFKDRGRNNIDLKSKAYLMQQDYTFVSPTLSEEEKKETLNLACDIYGDKSASALVEISHQQGGAWEKYFKKGTGAKIEDKAIKTEFESIVKQYFDKEI
jgi:uncharacterized phage-associated protein